jgi:hypothetical protein
VGRARLSERPRIVNAIEQVKCKDGAPAQPASSPWSIAGRSGDSLSKGRCAGIASKLAGIVQVVGSRCYGSFGQGDFVSISELGFDILKSS